MVYSPLAAPRHPATRRSWRSRLDTRAGLVGLALLLSDGIFDPERIDAVIG